MGCVIYTLDSLKIELPDDFEDVVNHYEKACKENHRVMRFSRPVATVIVTNKISAIVSVPAARFGKK
jgi:hypothetical protein